MVKVIIADCSPSVYAVVQAAFPGTEFQIFTFSDGRKMIAELEAIRPDVILLNLFLESKDGYEVCRFLNNQEPYKNIPLFLLRGAFESVDEERIGGLEYRELLEEPFDSSELLRKVRDTLGGVFDPQTLPEEPVSTEELSIGAELESRIQNQIAKTVQESEDRIMERLKTLNLKSLKKEE